jgi:hypothetical protein
MSGAYLLFLAHALKRRMTSWPRRLCDFFERIRQTADLLTAEQVAVYPISATGLSGEEATNSDAMGDQSARKTRSYLSKSLWKPLGPAPTETGIDYCFSSASISCLVRSRISRSLAIFAES